MISPLGRVLRDLRSAFEELGASWYVFGAQAAIAYGVVRSTGDIDVTVDSAERPTAAIADALVARGFSLKFADREFVEKTRVLPILHPKGVPVDVVFAGPGFDAVFFSRVVRRKLGGVIVPVAAAEDIIVMKVLAGREKDISDVKGMLAANRKIRVEQVRTVLAELETLLDQSDLQPAFEAALSAAVADLAGGRHLECVGNRVPCPEIGFSCGEGSGHRAVRDVHTQHPKLDDSRISDRLRTSACTRG